MGSVDAANQRGKSKNEMGKGETTNSGGRAHGYLKPLPGPAGGAAPEGAHGALAGAGGCCSERSEPGPLGPS